ncbi:primosome [Limosilactobacillus coleohominis DSM 14060]|nr:primosome [Limosilactobacillus coleohominis DSM 14060]
MAKIKKVYQKGFTTVDNTILNDEAVSWKAKGLFTYLWSKPDNWNYSVKEVTKHAKDGRDSTSDGVQELEELGYLKREQTNEKGSFGSSVWTLSERPIFKKQTKSKKEETPKPDKPLPKKPSTENPSTDLSSSEKSSTENPALLNTDLLNTDLPNTDITNNGVTNHESPKAPRGDDPFRVAQELNINVSGGTHTPMFVSYIDRLGAGLVCYALKKTNEQANNPGWRYLVAVLNRLESDGITTVQQAEEQDAKRRQQNQQRYGRKKQGIIKESLPDWFKKQQEQERKLRQQRTAHKSPETGQQAPLTDGTTPPKPNVWR